jgi:hypothetical protein
MDIYWNVFTMHGTMNVKFPNNTSKWQMEFNSAFKGLNKNKNKPLSGVWCTIVIPIVYITGVLLYTVL